MKTRTNDSATPVRAHTDLEAAREASRQARSAVRQEVGYLITEVEKLLRCVKEAADPQVVRVRAEVESAVAATKSALATRAHQVGRQASDTLEASDRYVHEEPWRAIGVAAISGLVIGLLLGRRRVNGPESS